jgi:two-component system sensor histidine kinase YesM
MKLLKSRRSFFVKLLVSYLLIGVLPVVTLGMFATVFTYTLPIKKLENQSKQVVYKSLESLEKMFDGYKTTLDIFAKDELVKNVLVSKSVGKDNRNVIYQKMFMLLSGKVTDSYMYLIKENGDFIISTTPDNGVYDVKKRKGWGIFRELEEREEAFVYPNRYMTANGKEISLSIAKRILVDGKTAGYAILDIPESTVERTLTAIGNLLDMNYMIMDNNFYIMYDDLLKNNAVEFFQFDFRIELLQKKEDIGIINITEIRNAVDGSVSIIPMGDPVKISGKDKVNKRAGLLCSLNSPKSDIILLAEVPVETILQNNKYIVVMTSLMLLFSIMLCCVLAVINTNNISKPIRKIVRAMEKVEKGDIDTRVEIQGSDDEIAYMARRFNEMIESLNDLFQKNMEKQDRVRLAEIKSLQAQINPHFLYNTLDSIKWLAKLNGVDEISVIVSKLGNLLKNSINNECNLVTVEESMYLIDSYLSIQKIRFDSKFDVVVDIDESIMQCLVPKLIIQPIVENAIVHGIENKIGESIVKITGKRENDHIVFEVEDDGIGISEEDLEKLRNSVAMETTKGSIGLSNIHNRIKLYYGEKYGLEIYSIKDMGTKVTVTMPVYDGCSTGGVVDDMGMLS